MLILELSWWRTIQAFPSLSIYRDFFPTAFPVVMPRGIFLDLPFVDFLLDTQDVGRLLA